MGGDHHVASQRPDDWGHEPCAEGVFPTTVPIYVWFGSNGPVIRATSTGDRLYVTSPSVDTTGVVDVSVQFSVGEAVNMTLADAFTFYESTTSPGAAQADPHPQQQPRPHPRGDPHPRRLRPHRRRAGPLRQQPQRRPRRLLGVVVAAVADNNGTCVRWWKPQPDDHNGAWPDRPAQLADSVGPIAFKPAVPAVE